MEKLYPKNNFHSHSHLFQYLGNDGKFDYYVLPFNQLTIDSLEYSEPLVFILKDNNSLNNINPNYSMILNDKYPHSIHYYKTVKKLLIDHNYTLNK